MPEPKLHRVAYYSVLDFSRTKVRRNRQSVRTRSDNGNVRTVKHFAPRWPVFLVAKTALEDRRPGCAIGKMSRGPYMGAMQDQSSSLKATGIPYRSLSLSLSYVNVIIELC